MFQHTKEYRLVLFCKECCKYLEQCIFCCNETKDVTGCNKIASRFAFYAGDTRVCLLNNYNRIPYNDICCCKCKSWSKKKYSNVKLPTRHHVPRSNARVHTEDVITGF